MAISLSTTVAIILLVYVCAQEVPCGYDALPRPPFLRGRILNGPEARVCEWPWMVAIRETGTPLLRLCAGSLIGKDKVITTASCLQRLRYQPSSPLEVILGEHDITVDNQNHVITFNETAVQVRDVIIHPDFSGKDNDIAVLRLMEDVTYSDCVLPACLPTARRGTCEEQVVSRCGYAGWGLYTDQNLFRSAKLRTAYGRYFNQELCTTIYRLRRNIIPVNTVCLDPSVQDQRPCQGDEGGMVSCSESGLWILESLINVPSCQDTYPTLGVDLRAPTIIDFITNN